MERTLVIIKPDAVQRALIGDIIARFEKRGLRVSAMKMMWIEEPLARQHYGIHEGKPFFEPLIQYITSSPVVVMALEGKNAIEVVRRTMGATNPAEAAPGTIRADLSLEVGRNLVHGSDGTDSAANELALFFAEEEIVTYERDLERWAYE